jgi:hypothetical protein
MLNVREEQPFMFSGIKQMNYERAGGYPTRHSQVSCYANSTTIANKICAILIACAADILTVSENSNMGFLRDGAATEAPATAVKRALVGGYAALIRFVQSVIGNLITYYEFATLVALPHHRIAQKAQLAGDVGCEGFNGKHYAKYTARRCDVSWRFRP